MAEKRNEIMEEQRKAREEFLKLKKMQSGEIQPEAKPSEIQLKPKTFGEKLKNFWYHYKVQSLIALALTAVLAIGIVQCSTREEYDYEVLFFAYKPTLDSQTDKVAEYLEKYGEDINGDGEVTVKVLNCSVSSGNKDTARKDILFRVQSVLSSEKAVAVYIVDEKAIKYFDNALDNPIFPEEPYPLDEQFYAQTELKEMPEVKMPEGLSIAVRGIEGTTLENDKVAKKAVEAGKKLIENIKKQNG